MIECTTLFEGDGSSIKSPYKGDVSAAEIEHVAF